MEEFSVLPPHPQLQASAPVNSTQTIKSFITWSGSIPDVKQMIASIDSDEISEQSCGWPWLERMHCLWWFNKPLITKWSLINPDGADLQLYLSSGSYN